jgi:hypothetical protein
VVLILEFSDVVLKFILEMEIHERGRKDTVSPKSINSTLGKVKRSEGGRIGCGVERVRFDCQN